MLRYLLAVVLGSPVAYAAEPPDTVAREIAVQKAIQTAKDRMKSGEPGAAAAALEAQLSSADGGREFLDLLGQAYRAELTQLRSAPTPDAARVRDVTARLAALGLAPASESKPVPDRAAPSAPLSDVVAAATGLFQKAEFSSAAKLFEKAVLGKVELRPDQMTAWAYCRVKVAADQLNQPGADAAVARAVEKEVTEALALAPTHEGLQKAGQDVLAAARKRAGGPSPVSAAPPLPAGWDAVESPSFRVRHQGNKALAESVAKAAEAKRVEIYTLWSGPPRGAWGAKCDIVLHAGAVGFTAATKQPAGATGLATVKIEDGAVTERRIDLRADDATRDADSLPRELTYVVVADLFPTQAPPKWAEVGMAVLASSPEEVGRYVRAARSQEGWAATEMIGMTGFPKAEKMNGFTVSAVTLVDHLVKARGEKAFTTFLRDAQRYGMEAALRRNYDTDAKRLDASLRQAAAQGQ